MRVFLLLLFFTSLSFADSSVRVYGVLKEKGTRKPMAQVNVFLLPQKLKTTTNDKGEFEILGADPSEASLVVNTAGYKKLEMELHLSLEQPSEPLKLYLEKESYFGFETIVRGKESRDDASVRTLEQEQFLTVPGAQGDPVKAVQNLPGVARVSGFSSQVIIQGGAPEDTGYLLEDHDVPEIFHFGGLTSIVTPEAVESVDYFSAGYGAEYGRATAGLVGLHLRKPSRDEQKGFAFVDLEKTGGLLEGPINDHSSYLVTGRYSYLGYVLGALFRGNSQLNLTVAPVFADFSAVYDNDFSSDDDFRLITLGSWEEVTFIFSQPVNSDPAIRGTFDDLTEFYRIIPKWTHHYSQGVLKTSVALGQENVTINVGSIYSQNQKTSAEQRIEYEEKESEIWTTALGYDGSFNLTGSTFNLPTNFNGGGVNNPISSSATAQASYSRADYDLGIYNRNKFHPTDSLWTHILSLRGDYFTETHEILPEPRFSTRYELNKTLSLKAATGIYYQAPQPDELSPVYGNPSLTAERAFHFLLGFDKDFRQNQEGYEWSSDVFYKVLDRLVVQNPSATSTYTNDGNGRVEGWENLLKYRKGPWTFWLVYTLSQSYRVDPAVGQHLFEYDQTHNLNWTGTRELGSNWKFSFRVRYVTGDPYTPVVGSVFDSDDDVYIPIRGTYYSTRNGPFFQADVRFDKKWIYPDWILTAYADIQNVTNYHNSLGIRYSYDYSQQTIINDLPILPILGVRGDF